jgi:hypothetical protein
VSVSEGRELLIRQIADEMAATITTTTHGGTRVREFWSKAALAALDRLGFEVIPASTLEADRAVLKAAEAWVTADMETSTYLDRCSAHYNLRHTVRERREAAARRRVSDD